MLACYKLFGTDRARQVQEMVESATGELCPCKQDKVCPLLPLDQGTSDQPDGFLDRRPVTFLPLKPVPA